MNPERWRRVEELFHAALDLSPDARGAFLEKTCGEDADLRSHVELLLSRDEHTASVMEKPILAAVMPQPENEYSFLPTKAVNRVSAAGARHTYANERTFSRALCEDEARRAAYDRSLIDSRVIIRHVEHKPCVTPA